MSKSALSAWMRAADLQERGLVVQLVGAGAGDVMALRGRSNASACLSRKPGRCVALWRFSFRRSFQNDVSAAP